MLTSHLLSVRPRASRLIKIFWTDFGRDPALCWRPLSSIKLTGAPLGPPFHFHWPVCAVFSAMPSAFKAARSAADDSATFACSASSNSHHDGGVANLASRPTSAGSSNNGKKNCGGKKRGRKTAGVRVHKNDGKELISAGAADVTSTLRSTGLDAAAAAAAAANDQQHHPPPLLSLPDLMDQIQRLSADLRSSPFYSDHPDNSIKHWHHTLDDTLKYIGEELWTEADVLRQRAERAERRLDDMHNESLNTSREDHPELSTATCPPSRYENTNGHVREVPIPDADEDVVVELPSNCKLYVGGLHPSVSGANLKDHFSQNGDVVNVDIVHGKGGRPKGFGSVTFDSAKAAEDAIKGLHGTKLRGKKIQVKWFRTRKDERRDALNADTNATGDTDQRRQIASPDNIQTDSEADKDEGHVLPADDYPLTQDVDPILVESEAVLPASVTPPVPVAAAEVTPWAEVPMTVSEEKRKPLADIVSAEEAARKDEPKPPSLKDIMLEEEQVARRNSLTEPEVNKGYIRDANVKRTRNDRVSSFEAARISSEYNAFDVVTQSNDGEWDVEGGRRAVAKAEAKAAEMARIEETNRAVEEDRRKMKKHTTESPINTVVKAEDEVNFVEEQKGKSVDDRRQQQQTLGEVKPPQCTMNNEMERRLQDKSKTIALGGQTKASVSHRTFSIQAKKSTDQVPLVVPARHKGVASKQTRGAPFKSKSSLIWKTKVEVENPENTVDAYVRRLNSPSVGDTKGITTAAKDSAVSLALYPTSAGRNHSTISPIFKMLQDPSTLPKAREILALEVEMTKLKRKEVDVCAQITTCEKEIERIGAEFKRSMKKQSTDSNVHRANKLVQEKMQVLEKRREVETEKMIEAKSEALSSYSLEGLEITFDMQKARARGELGELEEREKELKNEQKRLAEGLEKKRNVIERAHNGEKEYISEDFRINRQRMDQKQSEEKKALHRQLKAKKPQEPNDDSEENKESSKSTEQLSSLLRSRYKEAAAERINVEYFEGRVAEIERAVEARTADLKDTCEQLAKKEVKLSCTEGEIKQISPQSMKNGLAAMKAFKKLDLKSLQRTLAQTQPLPHQVDDVFAAALCLLRGIIPPTSVRILVESDVEEALEARGVLEECQKQHRVVVSFDRSEESDDLSYLEITGLAIDCAKARKFLEHKIDKMKLNGVQKLFGVKKNRDYDTNDEAAANNLPAVGEFLSCLREIKVRIDSDTIDRANFKDVRRYLRKSLFDADALKKMNQGDAACLVTFIRAIVEYFNTVPEKVKPLQQAFNKAYFECIEVEEKFIAAKNELRQFESESAIQTQKLSEAVDRKREALDAIDLFQRDLNEGGYEAHLAKWEKERAEAMAELTVEHVRQVAKANADNELRLAKLATSRTKKLEIAKAEHEEEISQFQAKFDWEMKHITEQIETITRNKAEMMRIDEQVAQIEKEYDEEKIKLEGACRMVQVKYTEQAEKAWEEYIAEKQAIQQSGKDYLARLNEIDRKKKVARDEAIAQEQSKIRSLEQGRLKAQEDIKQARQKFASVKGSGQREDRSFDINARDDFGNTFLIVAALRNDLETAELCIKLGAARNETNDDGFSAMSFASYFGFSSLTNLLDQHGASMPKGPFDAILSMPTRALDDKAIDWEAQLRIAEQAAIPSDTFMASAEELEFDSESRMLALSLEEQKNDYSCFENRLLDPNANKNFRRTVLIEKSNAHAWFVGAETTMEERKQFVALLRALIPGRGSRSICCHRRALVGIDPQFEVLCAALDPNDLQPSSTVVHFTPFVSSEVQGVADIGVVVWAVSSDSKATYVKALIEQAEFKRNKVKDPSCHFVWRWSYFNVLWSFWNWKDHDGQRTRRQNRQEAAACRLSTSFATIK